MSGYNRNNFGGFGGANLGQIMKQAQKMQQEMEEAKAELAETEFLGTSGGGMVEARMLGNRTLKSVSIKPEVIDPDDKEMLEDLICASINDCLAQIDNKEKEIMPQMPGMM